MIIEMLYLVCLAIVKDTACFSFYETIPFSVLLIVLTSVVNSLVSKRFRI